VGPAPKPISTLAEFDARLETLQTAADASSTAEQGRIPMRQLFELASTWYFIRRGDLDDTFRIAQILANDPEDLVQKAVGGWIREAGDRDERRVRDCLDRNAATMPRTALRYAIEHLPSDARNYYLNRKRDVQAQ
jgi:3-methyladenine DNA glycosylase AlkD